MIVKRIIKEQEQEYEYKGKPVNYDAYLHIRISKETLEELKYLALNLGYDNYTKMIRKVLNYFISKNKEEVK